MKKSTLTEDKAEQTPTGGVLVGKREGQTIIHNKGTLSGYLVGKTHAEGGIKAVNKSTGQPLEMQGGEVVITAPAVSDNTKNEFNGKMMTNREILSQINVKGGGVSFAKGGDIPKDIKRTGASYKYGGKTMTDHEIYKHITGRHLADGMTLSQIAKMHKVSVKELQKQVDLGMKAESEHTSSKREQMKIVKDHLYENPIYYTLLKKSGLKHGGRVYRGSLIKDAKRGNTPARDLNNYNDVLDLDADGIVGAETGLYVDGGAVGSDFTFLKSNPMQRARAITVLEKKIRHDGNIMSNYEFLEQLPKGLEVGVSKLFSRKSEKGYVEKLSIGDFIVDSKAEIDYYQYLQNGGYPYSKYVIEVREDELKKSEADKIVRNEQQRLKQISDIENYKNSQIAKKNQIKELIEKGADAIIKTMNAPRLMQIEKYKTQRQTNDVKQDIDFHTRMIEQTERQVNNAYKIASELYEIVNGEVQPKFDWKIGDKVKVDGFINHLPAEIETEIVELKENRFGEIAYRVESKEGIANSWISYDGLFSLKEKQNKNEYEYVLTQRPFGIGTYPKENFIRFEDKDYQYGVMVYSQKVPLKDVEHYSLCPITELKDFDGKSLTYLLGKLKIDAKVKLIEDKRKGYFVNVFFYDSEGIQKTQMMSGVNFLKQVEEGKFVTKNNKITVEPMNDIEITIGYFKVNSDNTGFEYAKKINNYFNKWNKIKTLKDKLDFERLDVPMFGSFENETVLDQIEHFEKIGFELGANEVVRNDFKKEVKKIIDKKIFDRDMDKRRYPKEDEEVAKKEKSFESEGSTEGKGKLYEFFTPQIVADKMLALAQHYGFKGGNVLEPATGSGRLIKNLKNTNITAFEISKDNFEILKREFPNAELYNFNFEKAFLKEPRFNTLLNRKGTETWLKNAPFDLVLANPPYGKFSGLYSSYFNFKGQVEHFFILQTLYLLKKGGLGVYLIPSSFLRNGLAYNEIKKQIFEIAEFVDAYRLPSNIFEKTQIGTDILILRKK